MSTNHTPRTTTYNPGSSQLSVRYIGGLPHIPGGSVNGRAVWVPLAPGVQLTPRGVRLSGWRASAHSARVAPGNTPRALRTPQPQPQACALTPCVYCGLPMRRSVQQDSYTRAGACAYC